MLPTDPGHPANLTATVELEGLVDQRGTTQVLTRSCLAITIHGIDGLEPEAEGVEADILYVIISGYGVLRCRDGARVEFTAGDVMMVPAGAWHRFEEVSPKFSTWRIVVGNPAQAKAADDGSTSLSA